MLAQASSSDYFTLLYFLSAAGLVGGWFLLRLSRKSYEKNYILKQATPMPLGHVNERDDVWLRGEVECPNPLTPPYFSHLKVIFYEYELEKERKRSTRNGTSTYWEIIRTERDAVPFYLKEGENKILVDSKRGEFHDLENDIEVVGKYRHRLSYLPCVPQASVMGSIGEKKEKIEPYQHIPLIITPKTRKEFLNNRQKLQRIYEKLGLFTLWGGLISTILAYLEGAFTFPPPTPQFHPGNLLTATLAGTTIFLPLWFVRMYNFLITYRQNVQEAWRQVDVDLKQRYDLIPQLVAVAEKFLHHEKELLEKLTQMRHKVHGIPENATHAILLENSLLPLIGKFLYTVENYPNLKSHQILQNLSTQLQAIEQKIAHGRSFYNQAVQEYNEHVLAFPQNIFARLMGWKTYPPFQIQENEKHLPTTK
ncbi:MAG: LemA family protein [Planctomycetota bacterium]|nr:MAG: LemA family protein [Planctomycetota bacterium]